MFSISEKATEVIREFLKDKSENAAVRITMSWG